ncbi:hypothetical protein I203_102552 [Kwoniella mangroviensis CBS 8507]|uniref:uncharacterized protein n=1 Tax=Kwoniella mangroviensis CBS 8507 TaxID=1296122 RepID=UPI00303963D0
MVLSITTTQYTETHTTTVNGHVHTREETTKIIVIEPEHTVKPRSGNMNRQSIWNQDRWMDKMNDRQRIAVVVALWALWIRYLWWAFG